MLPASSNSVPKRRHWALPIGKTVRLRRITIAWAPTALLAFLVAAPVRAQDSVEYYAFDAVGSVRVVFDTNGNVIGRMDYGPFGDRLSNATGMPSRAYAGLFRDGEAALDHGDARSYQQRTGRFSSVDPVYARLFEPQAWNRYAYAFNNPVMLSDPSGLLAASGQPPPCPPDTCTTVIGTLEWITMNSTVAFLLGWGGPHIGPTGGPQTPADGGHGRSAPSQRGESNTSILDTIVDSVVQVVETAKDVICTALPSGRVIGASGAIGFFAANVGGGELLLNYNTGELSAFGYAGMQGGFNGGISRTGNVGFVWGLGSDSSAYGGWFRGGALSVGTLGVSAAKSPTSPVTAVSLTAGASRVPVRVSGGGTATYYSPPFSFGNVRPFVATTNPIDNALFAARDACK